MAYETSNQDKMIAIRDKIKELINADPVISKTLRKVYKGTPPNIPNYPAVMLSWTSDDPEQVHKGQYAIRENNKMDIIVLVKYLNYDERQDILLTLTGRIKKLIVKNRYLNGLKAEDNSWRVQDIVLVGTRYEALIKPKTFVLDTSEIKISIVTEGIWWRFKQKLAEN